MSDENWDDGSDVSWGELEELDSEDDIRAEITSKETTSLHPFQLVEEAKRQAEWEDHQAEISEDQLTFSQASDPRTLLKAYFRLLEGDDESLNDYLGETICSFLESYWIRKQGIIRKWDYTANRGELTWGYWNNNNATVTLEDIPFELIGFPVRVNTMIYNGNIVQGINILRPDYEDWEKVMCDTNGDVRFGIVWKYNKNEVIVKYGQDPDVYHTVNTSNIRLRAKFKIADRVQVLYDDGIWYKGTIKEFLYGKQPRFDETSIFISFDGFDEPEWIAERHVQFSF